MVKTDKKKILVIDDCPFFIKTLNDLLKDEFHVQTANSGEEAIDLLKGLCSDSPNNGIPFDLIITDLNMPGMSGYDVVHYVRGNKIKKKFTPVIMLTEVDITKEEAKKHGCAAYVPKTNLNKVKSLSRILITR